MVMLKLSTCQHTEHQYGVRRQGVPSRRDRPTQYAVGAGESKVNLAQGLETKKPQRRLPAVVFVWRNHMGH